MFHVNPVVVVLEDLGSRNGVLVNSSRIEGRRELAHMDRIFIGAQEFLFIDATQITDRTDAERYVVCDSCGGVSGAAKRHCGDCGRRLDSANGATLADRSSVNASDPKWGEDTRPLRSLEVIGGIAEKAIKMGRFDEAERVLLPHLDEFLERAVQRRPLIDSDQQDIDVVFQTATTLALGLARGPSGTAWIDWVFRFHAALERVTTTDTIDALHELVRKHDYRRDRCLRAYLDVIGNQSTHTAPSDRFLIGRLESLAKVVQTRSSALRA
jgi:hypothetical protein